MGNALLTAFALMLILEGCVPLAAPVLWRKAFLRVTALRDGQIRYLGLASMLAGIAALALISLWD